MMASVRGARHKRAGISIVRGARHDSRYKYCKGS